MIQWYPGHMAKAFREMEEKIKLVDLIIILLDARIPESSLNPKLVELFQNKKVLYVLTKADKADKEMTKKWEKVLKNVISLDARSISSRKLIEKKALEIMDDKIKKDLSRGIKFRPIRTMIVGIPNVGKSTLINTLCGKKIASVEDRPGVTKSQQWSKINKTLELLDTPGVLWPKFDDGKVGYHLAITGAIKNDVLPMDDVCNYLINFLKAKYPSSLYNRYQIDEDSDELISLIGKKLGFLNNDKEVDIDKTSEYIVREFQNGLLGKVTLDWINDETLR